MPQCTLTAAAPSCSAERAAATGSGHVDEVDDDRDAVVAADLDALADRAGRGRAQHRGEGGAGLGGHLHLDATGVHGLGVGHDGDGREAGLELAHRLEALALEQRRAGLEQLGAAGDRFGGGLERALQDGEVQRDLQAGPACAGALQRGGGRGSGVGGGHVRKVPGPREGAGILGGPTSRSSPVGLTRGARTGTNGGLPVQPVFASSTSGPRPTCFRFRTVFALRT
jgi:hypothetical protein